MESTVIYEGHLLKKGWMSWGKRWFKLVDSGLLYFYKDSTYIAPSGSIDLNKTTELVELVPSIRIKQNNCFSVTVLESGKITVSHYLATNTDEERSDWLKHIKPIALKSIETNKSKVAGKVKKEEPDKSDSSKSGEEQERTNTPSWWGKTTKSLVSKVMVSKLGKKILKDWVSPDGIQFLTIMRNIIQKVTGSEVEATLFEQLALKTFTDVVLMITNKVLTKERVLLTRDSLFQLWSDALDMLEISFVFDGERLLDCCHKAWESITHIILDGIDIEKRDKVEEFIALFF
eukprot:TRINITY_DN25962_c0_g1_i1.p1 TRINITY_DN25962_c0_g1~~TRINITY_DN25962_c0_g1_i1.p1  ORF type:complete len:300 (-),score=61.29 TRINITY_DN25962_c0_g1_i1:162-1028(-)